MKRYASLVAASVLAFALAACHGGAIGAPGIPAVTQPAAFARAGSPAWNGPATVVLTIATASLNPAGWQAAVYVNWSRGASPTFTTFADVSAKSKLCKTSGATRTCTISSSVLAGGPYKVVVTLYNVPPKGGRFPGGRQIGGGVLETDTTQQSPKILMTTASQIASAGIVVNPSSMPVIDSGTANAIVTGYTANGTAIVSHAFSSAKGSIGITADASSKAALKILPATVSAPVLGQVSIAYSSRIVTSKQILGFTATLTAKPTFKAAKSAVAKLTFSAPKLTSVKVSATNAYAYAIAAGPDGNMWFTEYNAGKAGSVSTSLKLGKLFSGLAHPQSIAVGPDRNLWIADYDGNSAIARITPPSTINVYKLPVNTYPAGISNGPISWLWFGSVNDNYISWMTVSGTQGSKYPLSIAKSYPFYSAYGPDGNMYFVLNGAASVAKVTPSGSIPVAYVAPGTKPPSLQNIIVGADKNLWLTDTRNNNILRMTTSGKYTLFGWGANQLQGPLAVGPDGKIWFTLASGKICRLDPATGTVVGFGGMAGAVGFGIALGPDGALYVTANGSGAAYVERLQ